jgi:hypothetical protein
MTRHAVLLVALAAQMSAQYAGGTIFQSLDALQPSGVSAIGVPGNGSLTTGEILVYSNGWTNGAKALFSSEALGAVLGDRNGDGKPFDWVNVDAMHLTWSNPAFQPKPTDFRFSFEYDLVNAAGATVISNGDIFKLTGNGTFQVTIPRSAFISALGYVTPGTGYQLNVDGYAEMSDGTVLVSFKNNYPTTAVGQANNVIHPLLGTPTPNFTIFGEDVFAIRQPYGTLPAVLVYRNSDFQPLANALFSNYGTVFEIRDFDLQPGVAATTNPHDILGIWNGGLRPHIVFTFYGDENVVCTQPVPATGNTNVWALVQNANGVGNLRERHARRERDHDRHEPAQHDHGSRNGRDGVGPADRRRLERDLHGAQPSERREPIRRVPLGHVGGRGQRVLRRNRRVQLALHQHQRPAPPLLPSAAALDAPRHGSVGRERDGDDAAFRRPREHGRVPLLRAGVAARRVLRPVGPSGPPRPLIAS